MTNYKINKNKAPLSTEQVLKHKDFNQVMQNYKELHNYKKATKPLYKNIKFMGFMVLLFTVTLVLVFVELEESEEKQSVKEVKKEAHKAAADSVAKKPADSVTIVEEAPVDKIKTVSKATVTTKKEPAQKQAKDSLSTETFKESNGTGNPTEGEKEGKKVEVKNSKDVIYQKDKKKLEQELMRRHNQKEVDEDPY
jgi:hypothetical protein